MLRTAKSHSGAFNFAVRRKADVHAPLRPRKRSRALKRAKRKIAVNVGSGIAPPIDCGRRPR